MKRFQECSRIIKIWRLRWYLLIPFKWIYYMYIKPFIVIETVLNENGFVQDTDNTYSPKGKNLWSLLIGKAQIKMKWFYTNEEVFDRIYKKTGIK